MSEKIQHLENLAEIAIMKERLVHALSRPEVKAAAGEDVVAVFGRFRMDEEQARSIWNSMVETLISGEPLLEIERKIHERLSKIIFDGYSFSEALDAGLWGRASTIKNQISPFLKDIKGRIIDYGTGDARVAHLLRYKEGKDIEGVDVRNYKDPETDVPFMVFDGFSVPVTNKYYEAAILTNVLHHESQNERILEEIDRIVSRRLVIIETVPVGETDEEMEIDKDRTFMNDYVYNRLFHDADVPVPGTFETPSVWKRRFTEHGWQLTTEKDLGFDQPAIRDRHYLMVFERA
jgi:hypothetical protein